MKGGTVAELVERRIGDAEESLRRAEDALARHRGTLVEEDWRAQVERAEARLIALIESATEPDLGPTAEQEAAAVAGEANEERAEPWAT